jgi:ATP diphosphatase
MDPIFETPDDLSRLVEIMRRLRDPEGGCPWDIEQDFDSIAPYTIEEAHEVADAIARRAWDELPGELGDLLLQVIYHSRMAEEAGRFALADVVRAINAKMIARHPHVFGGESRNKSAAQQSLDWEAAKAAERAAAGPAGAMDGIAPGLPALMRAQKIGRRAARANFDWPDAAGVLDKIAEEAREVAGASSDAERAEELGDLLFGTVQLARHLGVDAEDALRAANAKFVRRFQAMEAEGPLPGDAAGLEAAWSRAKAAESAPDVSS